MVKSPECKKEISNPEREFHIGQENTGNQFHYAGVLVSRMQGLLRDYGNIARNPFFPTDRI